MDAKEAQAILDRYNLKPGDRASELRGSHRAIAKNALNWFRDNPPEPEPPKPKRTRTRSKAKKT